MRKPSPWIGSSTERLAASNFRCLKKMQKELWKCLNFQRLKEVETGETGSVTETPTEPIPSWICERCGNEVSSELEDCPTCQQASHCLEEDPIETDLAAPKKKPDLICPLA